mgnify:CR=1 FL=1
MIKPKLKITRINDHKFFAYNAEDNSLVGELFYNIDSIEEESEKSDGEFLFVNLDIEACFNSWSELFINSHFIPEGVKLIFIKYLK